MGLSLKVIIIVAVIALVIYFLWKRYSPITPFVPPDPPEPPKGYFTLQFVNETSETLLLGAVGPKDVKIPVSTVEGTWIMPPRSVLHMFIPPEWQSTQGREDTPGPRFWARTGCKVNFDPSNPKENKAVCETGDCGNQYNCSAAYLAGVAPVSLAEMCFKCGDGMTYYDVSLVDGYSISIDIAPVGNYDHHRPGGDPNDPFWCKANLCNAGVDLRTSCPNKFLRKSSDLKSFVPGDPDTNIACFSNCGLAAFPVAPDLTCDSKTDEKCRAWRKYCCQANTYGKSCQNSSGCTDGGACWDGKPLTPSSKDGPGTCQCRAYYTHGTCNEATCTNANLSAPKPDTCNGDPWCIGDDTFHDVCPRAYSWPNDPQTYICNARKYRVTFSPGGTSEPITPVSKIPKCSQLPSEYYDINDLKLCNPKDLGKYACAKRRGSKNVDGSSAKWDCNVDNALNKADNRGVACDGVTCIVD